MNQRAKIRLSESEQRGAVELGVTTDVVVRVRMERCAGLVLPHFLCVVLRVDVDRTRAPIVLLPWDEVASLEQKDALARWCKAMRKCATTGSGADDDDVVSISRGHETLLVATGKDATHVRWVMQLGAADASVSMPVRVPFAGQQHPDVAVR